MSLELSEGIRSCERGLGPPRRAAALPLRGIAELGGAFVLNEAEAGPRRPRDAALVGAWWAMREIELSSVRLDSVTLSDFGADGECGRCAILLPV
eukprot:10495564-Heterocapsa_arctica.AAC.1